MKKCISRFEGERMVAYRCYLSKGVLSEGLNLFGLVEKLTFRRSRLYCERLKTSFSLQSNDALEVTIMGLDELRARLDGIDNQMLDLLSKRAQLILQVADFKQQHKLPAHVPARETAIFERLRTTNPGPLSADAVERIYRTVIEEMRKFEEQHVTS